MGQLYGVGHCEMGQLCGVGHCEMGAVLWGGTQSHQAS